jgi:hypothetical protein
MLEALKKKGHDVEKLWEQISVSRDGQQVPHRLSLQLPGICEFSCPVRLCVTRGF